MSVTGQPVVDGRSPRAAEAVALLVVVSVVAWAARVLTPAGITTPRQSAITVAVAAGLLGLPALAWLFERGRLSVRTLASVGALAGVIPPMLLAVSGAVGLLVLGGGEYAVWALGHGASIPIYGAISWGRFFALVLWCVLVGAASGTVYGLLVPGHGWRKPAAWGVAVAIVAGMLVVGRWL